jgi:hypothetical protein
MKKVEETFVAYDSKRRMHSVSAGYCQGWCKRVELRHENAQFVSRVIRKGGSSLSKNKTKIMMKNIFDATHRDFRVFCGLRCKRAESSYPLFLWITMCIRVRELAVSEDWRGLHMNWR